jgi:hypothetical protein
MQPADRLAAPPAPAGQAGPANRLAAPEARTKPADRLAVQASPTPTGVRLRPAADTTAQPMTLRTARTAATPIGRPGSGAIPTMANSPLQPLGNILAADTDQIDRGARHLDKISDIIADIAKKLQVVSIQADGNGPIAKSIRANYTPASTSSVQFVGDLAKLVSVHSAQTTSLSRMLQSVDAAATDAAHNM